MLILTLSSKRKLQEILSCFLFQACLLRLAASAALEGKWMEVLGCRVTEQAILGARGTPDIVAWAFGLGLERGFPCFHFTFLAFVFLGQHMSVLPLRYNFQLEFLLF